MIRTYLADGRQTTELYDLSTDPGELVDLYARRREETLVRSLGTILTGFVRDGDAYRPGSRERNRIELEPEILDRLRALGYIE